MEAEVLGIFINTCHMLVPRCAAPGEAAYGNLSKKKSENLKEREREIGRGRGRGRGARVKSISH